MVKGFLLITIFLAIFGGFLLINNKALIEERFDKFKDSLINIDLSNSDDKKVILPATDLSGIEYLVDDENGVIIAKFDASKGITLNYDKDVDNTFENYAASENYSLAVNGSYFREDFSHAGLLRIDDEIFNYLVPSDQVTHVVMIKDGQFEIVSNDEYLSLPDDSLESTIDFQTGPLVILDDTIQTSIIKNSLNGNALSPRTVMGYTDDNKYFLAIFKRPISLENMSDYLLDSEIFNNSVITAINLDGGSSVAMYSKDNSNLNFGSLKSLPIIIGVK